MKNCWQEYKGEKNNKTNIVKAIIFFSSVFLILWAIFIPRTGMGSINKEADRQVIMLVVDGLSLEEWEYAQRKYPAIRDLMDNSSLALMNTGTAGGLNSVNAYVTIGAGARALGTNKGGLALNIEEMKEGYPAEALYRRYTGRIPQGHMVHLGINNLIEVNKPLNHRAVPGALGTLIREEGMKTALLGNGDGEEYNRLASTLIMDKHGIIDYGKGGKEILRSGEEYPSGLMMDVEKIWDEFLILLDKSQVIVIDWGDTFRLRESMSMLSPEKAQAFFNIQLENLGLFLEKIAPLLGEERVLLFFTPNPQGIVTPGGDQVSLLALYQGQEEPSGLLSSGTTMRPGLVASIDIAPTILDLLGLSPPSYLYGDPVEIASKDNNGFSYLLSLNEQISRVHQQRPSLIKAYILAQIVLVLAAVGGLIFNFDFYKYLRLPMVFLMLVPLSFLIYGAFPPGNLFVSFVVVIIFTLIFTTAFLYRSSNVDLFLRVGGVISLALVVDILTGANLMKNSVMGYDPVSGARFYGIGNEYMGILIGTSVLFAATLYQKMMGKKTKIFILIPLSFVFITYLFISPAWGANFGGSLTALVAFTVTYLGLEGKSIKDKKIWVGITGAGILFFAALIFLNFKGDGEMVSHVGRAMWLIRLEGGEEAMNIIHRKAAMNAKLFRYSLWSRILVLFLALKGFLYYHPPGLLRKIKEKYEKLYRGFAGIIAGSIAAILLNDSGVVAGATVLLYGGIPLLLLALEERVESREH